MKEIYAKTDYTESFYLTAGKEYLVKPMRVYGNVLESFKMVTDGGSEIFCCVEKSSHIDGNDWQIIIK